jgi:hypothetical protein
MESDTPIDLLASRVWSGSKWHYPHIEAMLSDIDRLRAELAAEGANTASLLHTLALIREAGKWQKEMLSELPGAVKAMREQRDEARQDACAFEAINRWNIAHPNGIISECAVVRISREIAVERGWDCYAEKEGGGA